jgi:hypothetical protein
MPIQKCPMCLETKNVVSSHLIPAKAYEYFHAPGAHPISISSKVVMGTDRQLQAYLLCLECEDRLNKGGEMWLLPLFATYEGSFPFYDLLTKVPPEASFEEGTAYFVSKNPAIQVDKLVHFGMGMFFKAAVHSWEGGKKEPMIEMGPYLESVRAFLIGKTGFPERMTLNVGVLPPPVKAISCSHPYRGSNTTCHNYLFYISGIEFALGVGKQIDLTARQACFASNPLHPIIVTDYSEDIRGNFNRVWKKAKKAKNLGKYMKNLKDASPNTAK